MNVSYSFFEAENPLCIVADYNIETDGRHRQRKAFVELFLARQQISKNWFFSSCLNAIQWIV